MTKRTTIIDFVNEYVDKYQNDTYLREKVNGVWTETSFIKTRDEARLIAAGFMSLGLNKGDKVSLLAEARPMWVITEFGILFAGGVDVPLSYKLESDYDLTFRINHSDSRFIVASEMEIEKVRRVIAQCPAIEKVIVMDDIPLQEGEIYLKDVREAGVKFIEEHPGELEARMASVGPDDYANISYTSGTTADPKGILLTHRNYTANVAQGASVISIDRGDIMLIILPMDHCFAHVAGLYTMMSYGGSIATVPGKTPQAQLRNIIPTMKEIKPQVMLTVPAISRSFKKAIENGVKAKGKTTEKLYNMALKNARAYYKDYYNQGGAQFWRKPFVKLFDKIIFSKIRETFGGKMKFCVGGGALLDIELQRYFCAIGMPTFQGYGLSEATPIICSNAPGFARFGSSGRIVSPMECTIRDDENRILPNGQTGEIVIKGENVMAGYWKNPEATAETIVDGWLHTGDRGYICKEDPRYLYVTGRFKSLLISSDGEKYSPEGYEDNLAVVSKYIDNVILHNNQSPYTIVLVVPNKEALRAAAPGDKEAQLRLIQADVDSYRKGGIRAGRFPEKWLPTAIVVCEEPFTEKNGLVNSTGKVVRGKVEKHFEKRIEYAYTPEGKQLINPQNMAALD
ncbi:MAG: AMP-binding protein [Candidatus Cryptobacteroides sp.]|nr:AMP-binding protein [Bacteroidales bacterium]MDY5459694.1 AMP-binding protein [Candidatus Cryptobacteroides sp.]